MNQNNPLKRFLISKTEYEKLRDQNAQNRAIVRREWTNINYLNQSNLSPLILVLILYLFFLLLS
jgi:hypothetical protein